MALGPCELTAAPPEAGSGFGLSLGSHPNPFNPRTTVSFELPHAGHARVEAFDTRGRRVATLVDEDRAAGRFELPWLGRDDRGQELSSGVYFLRLTHAAGEKVERVTLIK
jgi:flagellar hook assembly protein FlgD